MRAPFPPQPLQHFSLLGTLIAAILTGVRWSLIVVLNCISLMAVEVEQLFIYLLTICMSSGRMSVQVLCPFLIELFVCSVLSCMSSLCILDINPLSELLFANTFSHLVGHLFVLLAVSFSVQKLFSLIQSHSFIFAFTSLAFGFKFKKSLKPRSRF